MEQALALIIVVFYLCTVVIRNRQNILEDKIGRAYKIRNDEDGIIVFYKQELEKRKIIRHRMVYYLFPSEQSAQKFYNISYENNPDHLLKTYGFFYTNRVISWHYMIKTSKYILRKSPSLKKIFKFISAILRGGS